MTDDAVSLLNKVGYSRAHVLGISMGGMVAQMLALDHPQMCASLTLGATTHGGREAMPPPPEVCVCARV